MIESPAISGPVGAGRFADQLTPEVLAMLRGQRNQPAAELRVGAGDGFSKTASRQTGVRMVEGANSTSVLTDEEGEEVDDDDVEAVIMGDVWRQAFEYFVGQLVSRSEVSQYKQVRAAMDDPNQSVALRVLALRLFGEKPQELDSVEKYLAALERLMNILADEKADGRLREMAYFWLSQYPIGRTWRRPSFLPNGERITEEMLEPYGKRLDHLAGLASREAFQLYRPSWRLISFSAPTPCWPDVLPELLGIRGDERTMADEALKIFENYLEPRFRRDAAVAYFSYLIQRRDPVVLSQKEADDAILKLFATIADYDGIDLLGRLAEHAYLGVVGQRLAAVEGEEPKDNAALLQIHRWAKERYEVFQLAFANNHRGELAESEWDMMDRAVLGQILSQDAIKRLAPPWYARLRRRLAGRSGR